MSGETKKPIVINFFNSKNNNFMTKIKSLNSGQSPGIVDYLGPTMPSEVELQDLPKLQNGTPSIQKFYEELCQRWFDSSNNKLWNFTINPDPKMPSSPNDKKTWGKIKDSLIKKRISDLLTKVFNRKCIRDYIKEVVLYWEYGDKSGKFHCNCTLLIEPNVDDKIHFYIKHTLEEHFGSHKAVFFKDGRKFKSADFYNCKDAGFMHSLNFKPLWLTHKLSSINL